MKFLINFLCFGLIFSNQLLASEPVKWAMPDVLSSDLNINELRFTNRARCALDSKKPTESAFILVQNMEVAKGLYRLAKATDNNSTDLTKMGISVYRYSIIQIIKYIHEKLASGELPLLPADAADKNSPSRYSAISAECKSDGYCSDLDEYISSIWKVAHDNKNFSKVDNFKFIDKKVFNNNKNLTCHYLKKFSPLQAQLFGTKPNGKVFEEIAKAGINKDEYLADCSDIEAQIDLKVASYQIEIPEFNEREFGNVGFDYWNSLKLYFSWAFRNAPEFEKMAAPFGEVLKGVALEDSVMIIPSGCKSITPTKCGGDYVQLNTIREFAKADFKKKVLNTDILSSFPDGPQENMIDEPTPAVNTDIGDLANFENAEKWLENLRDNLANTKGIMKRKLISSINFLNLVTPRLTPEKMAELISASFAKLGIDESTNELLLNSTLSKEEEIELKNELYYLCSEFTQASHEDFSFIKGDLEILKKTSFMEQLAGNISEQTAEMAYAYYKKVASLVNQKCNSINQKNLWDENFQLDKTGFSKWYLDKIHDGKVASSKNEKYKNYLLKNPALISYKTNDLGITTDTSICANGVDCARKTLEAIIDLYAVAQYANTFWSMDQMVKTPAFFNPYAERTACKVYDPWFKTKQLLFNLFTNMGQAAMSAFVPGAGVFASLDLQPGRVVSFKQLVEEGKIEYDVNRNRASIFKGLMLDLGPLIGVPCQISISKYFDTNFSAYNFSGITVGSCINRENSNIDVYSASEIGDPEGAKVNTCASCTLNFESIVHSSTAISNLVPYAGSALFFFDGMVRLVKGLQDPNDIPKKWKANPNFVMDTYRRFGEIPKKCNFKLRNGNQCLKNRKEEKIQSIVRTNLKTTNVVSMKYRPLSPNAEVIVNGCTEPIKVFLRVKGGDVTLPESCKHLSKGKSFETVMNEVVEDLWRDDNSAIEDYITSQTSDFETIDMQGESSNSLGDVAEASRVADLATISRAIRAADAARNAHDARLANDPQIETARVEAARIEAAKAESARVEAAKAESARVEAAKAEATRVEAAKAEATRIEAAKAEAARIEAEKAEATRIEAEKAEASRVTVGNLKTIDCLVTKKDNETNSLSIFTMKVTGINENSEAKAKWFIKNPAGDDIPLYKLNKTQEVLFINNKTIRFNNPMPKEIEIYLKDSKNSIKKVSIEGCKGFPSLNLEDTRAWR